MEVGISFSGTDGTLKFVSRQRRGPGKTPAWLKLDATDSYHAINNSGWHAPVIGEVKNHQWWRLSSVSSSFWRIPETSFSDTQFELGLEVNEYPRSFQIEQCPGGNVGAAIVGAPQHQSRPDKTAIKRDEKPISELIGRIFWSYYTAAVIGLGGGLLIGWLLTRRL